MAVQNILVASTKGMRDCLRGTPRVMELIKAFPDSPVDLTLKKIGWNFLSMFRICKMFTAIRIVWYVKIFLVLKLLFKLKYSPIYIFHANNDFGRIKTFSNHRAFGIIRSRKWCPD